MSSNTPPDSTWFGWLKSIDMFEAPIRLHIHKQTGYRTRFSGLLSLAVIFGVVGSALSMIIDALYYANINFLTTFAPSTNNVLILNSTNFVMAVQVNDNSFSPTNSYYSIDFKHVRASNSGTYLVEPLGTSPCTVEYLQKHLGDLSGQNITTMLCPTTGTYPIESKGSQYIQLSIKKCENSTSSSITCASQTDIDDYFSDPRNIKPLPITLYTTTHVLDMLTPIPDIRYLKSLPFIVPGGYLGRQSDMYIYEEIVNVEKSVLNNFKKGIEAVNTFTIDERIADQVVYAADGTYFELNIKKSQLEKKYVRSFTKIEEILAFLGGLAKALVIIATAIAVPFNHFYYNLAISNEIYEFESRPKVYYQKTVKGKAKAEAWRKSSKTFSNLDHFTASKEDPIEEGNLAFNRRLIHNEKVQQYHPFFESLLMRHHRLQYTVTEAVKGLFCCFKRRNTAIKKDLYDQAEHRLRKDIDIITILKKLQDVDKLKELLLDNNQLELFNYKKPLRIEYLGHLNAINKIPLINKRKRPSDAGLKGTADRKKSMYLHDRPLDTVEQFKGLFEAYKIVIKDRRCDYNVKLGEMLGSDLVKIFQKLDDDFQSDMATITRKSSQLNKADLDAVNFRSPPSSENPSKELHLRDQSVKSEPSNSDEGQGPHTFGVMNSDRRERVKKKSPSEEELDENTRHEDQDVRIHVSNPKFPMKELKKREKKDKKDKKGKGPSSYDQIMDGMSVKSGGNPLNTSYNL